MTAENINTDLPLLGIQSMRLAIENASYDLPPIGFSILFLLGSERCAQFGFVFFLLFNFSDKQLRCNRKKAKNRQKTE